MKNDKTINIREEIKKVQDTDTLKQSEEIFGQSYKENEDVALFGMLLQMEKSKEMEFLMDITDDTKFSETTEEYLRKVKDFGFEIVLEEPFNYEGIDEKLFVLWHRKFSILLSFDTYHGYRNGGKFYYNWSPNEPRSNSNLTQSGGWKSFYMDFADMTEKLNPDTEPRWDSESWDEYKLIQKEWRERDNAYIKANNLRRVWSGDHDCREGLKNNISLLSENGVFLNKWLERPFMWLCHHGDTKDREYGSYDDIIQSRFEKLPDFVKDCIPNKR